MPSLPASRRSALLSQSWPNRHVKIVAADSSKLDPGLDFHLPLSVLPRWPAAFERHGLS